MDCCAEDLKAGNFSDNSIYQLQSIWKDQNGNEIKIEKFEGKHLVLAMIYTSCPSACPVIVNDMERLESLIPKDELKNYHFILVSIDPQRDTPQQMKKYAEEKKLNEKYWTLLTGSKESVAELAQVIGFNYKENKSGMFTHSNLITFLDKQGIIEHQVEGLNNKADKLLAMLNK